MGSRMSYMFYSSFLKKEIIQTLELKSLRKIWDFLSGIFEVFFLPLPECGGRTGPARVYSPSCLVEASQAQGLLSSSRKEAWERGGLGSRGRRPVPV